MKVILSACALFVSLCAAANCQSGLDYCAFTLMGKGNVSYLATQLFNLCLQFCRIQATIIKRSTMPSNMPTGPSTLCWSISTTTSIAAMMMVQSQRQKIVLMDASTVATTAVTIASKTVWAGDFF